MKIDLAAIPSSSSKKRFVPPIPLERPVKAEPKKGEYHSYKLRSNPTDASSPTYELTVPIFNNGTCEEWLKWMLLVEEVIKGQHVTSAPGKFIVACRLLQGAALTTFDSTAALQLTPTGQPREDLAAFNACLEAVTVSVFPARAALMQKRYLRRFVRKPATMKIRDYAARLSEINNYLPSFPENANGEKPEVLPEDEMVDLMEFGVPNSWQRYMALQDFEPLDGTVDTFVKFCERIEHVEVQDGTNVPKDKKRGREEAATQKANAKGKKGATKFFCLLHGANHTHNSDQCKALKKEADKLKSMNKPAPQSVNLQELNTLVKGAIADAMKKRPKRDNKKRARTQELNNFSQLSISDDSDHADKSSAAAESDSDSE